MTLSTNDIRTIFLQYFAEHGHSIVPSAPLVPHNDPTLMFTNAGMVPFKNMFTGVEQAPNPPRATSSQKCVRAGGKHNDLDNVGYTARHHTFFEMLGNFSFGDYFKEQAIVHAWELLTKNFGLPKEKLLATVYHTDDEAFDLWRKISGLPEDRIIRIASNDNFWMMGDTGPCGPCTEVFYDHGAHIPGGPPGSADEDGDRFIEIWNVVFMQYEQREDGQRVALKAPSIDTGMGLERVAAILQGVHSNYEIDTFQHLIQAAQSLLGVKQTPENSASFRVIADHLRACGFLIADGVMPSNEGRGYVLRRIMRRAMRHAHMLGATKPLMHQLVGALQQEMGAAFPELHRADALIRATLESEEVRFKETLGRGLKLLDDARADIAVGAALPGEVAFKLYDTYGFPLDLTQDILRAASQTVDIEGFNAAMAEQKSRARAAWKGSGEQSVGALWFDIKDASGSVEFLGYTASKAEGELRAIVKDGAVCQHAKAGDQVQLLFNQTPFYGESGGQTGDIGTIWQANVRVAIVQNTTKPLEDVIVHHALLEQDIQVGQACSLRIDVEHRDAVRANHSATHLLHAALRNVLGEHVTQKGSLVEAERLRFDFSHNAALSAEELAKITQIVNQHIWRNSPVKTMLMSPDEAINAGAMALFGEKYGDEVRVLSMGADAGQYYSVELCGGTHVERTGDIGLMVILSESAIAAGVRRIEAVTRAGAFAYLAQQDVLVQQLAQEVKAPQAELVERTQALLQERKQLQKELADAKKQLALGGSAAEVVSEAVGVYQCITRLFDDLAAKELRPVAEDALKQADIAIIGTRVDAKAALVVAIRKEHTPALHAGELVKIAAEALQATGGGGRPDMAQTGGADASLLEAAVHAIKQHIEA